VPYDVNHALEHADVAGWVLGALDPADAAAFETHVGSCQVCQAAVADLEPVARSLRFAAPAVDPPADLQARTIAAVQDAIMAAARPEQAPVRPEQAAVRPGQAPVRPGQAPVRPGQAPVRPGQAAVPAQASRWWQRHWRSRFAPLFTAVGAAAVTAAAFLGVQLFAFAAPAAAATYVLSPQPGQAGSATATTRDVAGGYEIQLTARDLPKLGPGEFFECWYVGPDSRPGHPELITGGTFSASHGTFTMWTAAEPGKFRQMEITEEKPGAGNQQGQVILTGTAQHVHDDD
jgi:hypothetical protein